jgi:hypothetical protein
MSTQLRHMCPVPSPDDVRDGGLVDAVDAGKITLSGAFSASAPDLAHVCLGQLRLRVPLSPRDPLGVRARTIAITVRHAPLSRRIEHVLVMRGGEEMIRPDAGRVVARVADVQSRRNRTVRQFIREPMCLHSSGVADAEHAIASTIAGSAPEPAPIGFLDVLPQSLGERPSDVCPVADLGAERVLPLLADAVERHPAVGAMIRVSAWPSTSLRRAVARLRAKSIGAVVLARERRAALLTGEVVKGTLRKHRKLIPSGATGTGVTAPRPFLCTLDYSTKEGLL